MQIQPIGPIGCAVPDIAQETGAWFRPLEQ